MARANGPITVCVINLKGGVGKSTISALLARRAFSHRRLDVLAIDLDPQANLSQSLMAGDYNTFLNEKRPSIVEIFNDYRPPTSKISTPVPLHLSDAIETIAQTGDRTLQLIPSRFDFSDNLLGAVRPDPRTLARYLSANFQHKDLIIIDCAPTESILTTAAYHASGNVLVPVKPEFLQPSDFPCSSNLSVILEARIEGTTLRFAVSYSTTLSTTGETMVDLKSGGRLMKFEQNQRRTIGLFMSGKLSIREGIQK